MSGAQWPEPGRTLPPVHPDPVPFPRRVSRTVLAGLVGPAAFVGAWVVGGLRTTRDYSPVHDPISRLAAVGADSRTLMTAGFVTFGVALPVFAAAAAPVIGRRAAVAAALTGLSTLAVAATPLDRSAAVDTWHGVAAGLGYVTLAATPVLAAGRMRAIGAPALARAGRAAGATSAVALLLTTTGLPTGLVQRVGLTVTDLWIAAVAVAVAWARGR